MDQFDVVIIGGGIVGLATGYQLLKAHPDLKLALLEKEKELAYHQSGHNSGVIHSGIYYKPGSLKAKNCVEGVKKLIQFCNEKQIAYELCGKVIVASYEHEIPKLEEIYARGLANQVPGIKLISPLELKKIEPYAACVKALHIPNTGITDYKKIALALADEIKLRGGEIFLEQKVISSNQSKEETIIKTLNREFTAKLVINCAGLQSDSVAKALGEKQTAQIVPFRGEYYYVKPEKRYLLKSLIYPVPDPKFPFLGVHFTKKLSGEVKAGPNAVLALAKEGYLKKNINLNDMRRYLSYPGFWKLITKHWKMGCYELYRSYYKEAFVKDAQKLIPDIKSEDFVEQSSGVRAQMVLPNGQVYDDFYIQGSDRILNVLNAPSPAATSCLSIGDYLSKEASLRLNLAITT